MSGEGGLSGVRLITNGGTVPAQGEWFAAPDHLGYPAIAESAARAKPAERVAGGSNLPAAE